jgi:hypothetical protein
MRGPTWPVLAVYSNESLREPRNSVTFTKLACNARFYEISQGLFAEPGLFNRDRLASIDRHLA